MNLNFNNQIIIFWITFFSFANAIANSKYHMMRRNIYANCSVCCGCASARTRSHRERNPSIANLAERYKKKSAHTRFIGYYYYCCYETRHGTNQSSPTTIAISRFILQLFTNFLLFAFDWAYMMCLWRLFIIANSKKGKSKTIDASAMCPILIVRCSFVTSTQARVRYDIIIDCCWRWRCLDWKRKTTNFTLESRSREC